MEFAEYREDGDYEVKMRGRFTFADHAAFLEVIEEISSIEVRTVRFNLTQLEFVDSAAMGMFLLALEEANNHHKPIALKGAQGQVKKMFHVARFDALFSMDE